MQCSQKNRRQAVLRRLGASRPTSSPLSVHRNLYARSPPLLLPAAETAGYLAAIGLSDAKYNRLQKGFGAGLSQLASLPRLRQARTLLLNSSAYEVSVEDSGSHRTQLRLSVEERLGRLCGANLSLERPLYDSSGKAIRKTRIYTIPATGGPTYPDGWPPADILDAQISIGLDKGGSPSSVKVVVGLLNQAAPNRVGNTLLLAVVCPCEKEKYEDVAAMLRPHRAADHDLLGRGVIIGGQRRAACIFLTGDNLGITTVIGHKGPNASLPCPTCLATKLPTKAHLALDLAFGSMQDLCCTHPPRHSSHLVEMGAALTTGGRTAAELGLSVHLSIERPPLVIVDPRKIVPSPVHLTIGITRRILRLGVEILIADRSPLAGWLFSDTLVQDPCEEAGVHPVPYHGGNFIGSHCGTIARRRYIVCRGSHGRVSSTRVSAHTRAWQLWAGLVPTLNGAAYIPRDEQQRFASDATAFVGLLQREFPWINISPKLNIFLCHAGEVLCRFRSIGLYGEPAVDAWHDHINQNAAQFSAGTEVRACVRALRAAALAGAATDAVLRLRSPIRKRKPGGSRPARLGDRRRMENKGGVRHCRATTATGAKERPAWSKALFFEALDRVENWEERKSVETAA